MTINKVHLHIDLIFPLKPTLLVISLLDVEAQSVHDQPLALMEMIFRRQASSSQTSPLSFQIGTITLAAHAEGVDDLVEQSSEDVRVASAPRWECPRVRRPFHSLSFDGKLDFSMGDWLIQEFLIACRVQILFPTLQNGWRVLASLTFIIICIKVKF